MNKFISKIKGKFKKKYNVEYSRLDISQNDDLYDSEIKKVINLLSYTKSRGVSYSGGEFRTGYHTLKIGNYKFEGQRDPLKRFENLNLSLDNKNILDIGCNQGGMLHSFSSSIKSGVGVDFDPKMINVANKIKSYSKTQNLDFYVFNLEEESFDYLLDFNNHEKYDVIFLLSVCMWISNWKDLIDFCAKTSEHLVFETNGSNEQQKEQINKLKSTYKYVEIINKTSEDDKTQKNRQLLHCKNN